MGHAGVTALPDGPNTTDRSDERGFRTARRGVLPRASDEIVGALDHIARMTEVPDGRDLVVMPAQKHEIGRLRA